jgi:hypothetical protein
MTSTEGTPIGDEAQAAAAAQPTEATKPSDSAPDAEPTPAPTTEAPDTAKPVKADVERALARETQDGKGEEDPGPSDWISYATEGVEKETDQ